MDHFPPIKEKRLKGDLSITWVLARALVSIFSPYLTGFSKIKGLNPHHLDLIELEISEGSTLGYMLEISLTIINISSKDTLGLSSGWSKVTSVVPTTWFF